MEEEHKYDVVLNDQLQWTYVPRISKTAKAAAAEGALKRRFFKQWTEDGGIGKGGSDGHGNGYVNNDDEEDDDIGAVFTTNRDRVANANRDIGRLLSRAHQLYAKDSDKPDMATGHKMVLLDRARRIAFGCVKPPPMTLAQGLDGGVNIAVYQRRRARPDDDVKGDSMVAKTAKVGGGRNLGRTLGLLPRHRRDTGTACVGVLPDQFRVSRGRPAARVATKERGGSTRRRNRASRLQRALAEYLLRQPAESAVRAALRHI